MPNSISNERSFCLYCRGNLADRSEIDLGYHSGCQNTLDTYEYEYGEKDLFQLIRSSDLLFQIEAKMEEYHRFHTNDSPIILHENSIITYIDLGYSQLTFIEDIFSRLRRVKVFKAKANKITTIPEWIYSYKQLIRLDFSYNQVKKISDNIGMLSKLKSLEVRDNNIKDLPDSIGELSNLKNLDVSKNNFTELPGSMRRLKKLTHLSIRDNNLTIIPEFIGELTNLNSLDISNNQITEIPVSIGNLTDLCNFNVSINQLTEIPTSILNLQKLIKFDATNNPISKRPTTNDQMLKYGYLDDSIIQDWENEDIHEKEWNKYSNRLLSSVGPIDYDPFNEDP